MSKSRDIKKTRRKQGITLEIPYPALSTNKIYAGVKRRSHYYKKFRKNVLGYLEEEYGGVQRDLCLTGNLQLHMIVGFSSPLSDLSNSVKAIEDCAAEFLGFNDRYIARILLEKRMVKKGSEFITFNLKKYRKDIDWRKR
jgi:Holliday junction resolvase RusA-like endonuclease